MRATFLIAFLALTFAAGCPGKPDPASATPMPTRATGYIQEFEGHHVVFVVRDDVTLVIPFDEPPPGTLMVKQGVVNPLGSMKDLALPPGGGICPCCVRTCGSPCDPGSAMALPCEPLPSFAEWPGNPFRMPAPNP